MILQGTSADFKDWLQIGFSIVAVAGGIKAILEWQENLRWKRANAARDIISEIHRHKLASGASLMLDYEDGKHLHEIEEHQEMISYQEVIAALAKKQSDDLNVKEVYIRDCFDWFFYFIDRIEHYVRIKLIKFEYVEPVFKPYASKLKRKRAVYEGFMQAHDYDLALDFWRRYWDRAL